MSTRELEKLRIPPDARLTAVVVGVLAHVDAGPDRATVSIVSRRRPRIAKGGVIVLLSSQRQGLVFSAHAAVDTVSTDVVPDGEGGSVTRLQVQKWEPFSEDLTLDALKYSLTIVRDPRSPLRHFRPGYRRLPPDDLRTLESGEVFVARTAYHELLSALPEVLRNAFLSEEVMLRRDEEGFGFEGRFARRLRDLYAFIVERVISVGCLLEDLVSEIEKVDLRDESGNAYVHSFFEEDGSAVRGIGDNIADQAALFRGLNGEDQEERNETRIKEVVSVLRRVETRDHLPRELDFERLFRRAP
jgi:hypothetical protein